MNGRRPVEVRVHVEGLAVWRWLEGPGERHVGPNGDPLADGALGVVAADPVGGPLADPTGARVEFALYAPALAALPDNPGALALWALALVGAATGDLLNEVAHLAVEVTS